jgi:flagellar protein FliO/FliZ
MIAAFRRSAPARVVRRCLAAAVLAACHFPGVMAAADDNTVIVPGAAKPAAAAPTLGSSFNTLTLVLGVAMAAVGGWLILRNRRAGGAPRDTRALALEETRSLGNRQFLVVASYEGKKFLIGVCPGRIELVAPLDGPAEKARS